MNIKLVHPWFCTKGGAERVIVELARELSKDNEVQIITNYYESSLTFPELQDFDVKVYPPLLPYRWKLSRALGSALFFYNLKIDADIIIADISPSHWIANKNRNVVGICYTPLRDAYDLYENHVRERPIYTQLFYRLAANTFRHYDRKIIPKIRYILSISEVSRERVLKYYGRNSEIIHLGVNPDEFYNKKHENYFLWVGRFMNHKRPQLAIDAMKDAKGFLYMVGAKGEIVPQTTNGVWFFYDVPDADLRDLYSKCIAYIYTAKDEEWSISMLEAMASGKPVIAVDEGCAKEIIEDNVTGLLVDSKPISIAEAMDYLIGHPDEAEEMGKAARKTVEEKYSWKVFWKQFKEIIENASEPEIRWEEKEFDDNFMFGVD